VRSAAVGAALLLLTSVAQAQWQGRIDAGLGGPGGWSLAPELELRHGAARLELTGEYRDFQGTGQAAAGRLAASWFRPVAGPALLEVTGAAQAQYGIGLTEAGSWWAGPRLHLRARDRGIWLGLQGGRDYLGPVRRWEAAAWKSIGQLSIQLQGWQTSTSLAESSSPDSIAPFPDTLTPQANGRRVRTSTDLGLWVRWGGRRADVMLASGMRFGLREPALSLEPRLGNGSGKRAGTGTVSSTWWIAEGTWWLNDRVGLAGTVGRQPTDPALAATGQSFLRVGFRAALGRRRREPELVAPLRPTTRFVARRGEGAMVEFTLQAPKARQVEIMGDFTDWSPVSMEQRRGAWRVRLPASPGLHRVNVRYDDGPWQAPPVSHIIHDEFGHESGEVLVE
jgi:hypothetical protein